ncbi:MAG: response regulator [Bacteroidales bacterium]|nr:response regulator [Bacteroidales bacterium]
MGKLIFFVDDERSILHFMEYTFKNLADYDVMTFQSGEECVKHLEKDPSLVIIDHNMAVTQDSMNGLDLLLKIKEYSKDIPVIVLSGTREEDIIKAYSKFGATKFVSKDSFFVDTLKEEILRFLS